jgi:hypothetical protein
VYGTILRIGRLFPMTIADTYVILGFYSNKL